MDTNLAESINTFGHSPKADFESPAEPSVIVPAAFLQDLLGAVQDLKEEIAQDRQEIAALRARIADVETTQEQDTSRICCDIAYDRQRLAKLEQRPSTAAIAPAEPKGAKTLARIAKIDEVLKSRGPTTLKQLEHILGIDRATMTRLLGKLDMRRYELHSRPGDDREKVLRLKVQIR